MATAETNETIDMTSLPCSQHLRSQNFLAQKGSFDAGSLFAATATGAGASNASLG